MNRPDGGRPWTTSIGRWRCFIADAESSRLGTVALDYLHDIAEDHRKCLVPVDEAVGSVPTREQIEGALKHVRVGWEGDLEWRWLTDKEATALADAVRALWEGWEVAP